MSAHSTSPTRRWLQIKATFCRAMPPGCCARGRQAGPWRGEHRAGLPSQLLPPCRYSALPSRSVRAKLFFFPIFFFFRGLHGRRCQHDMLGLNSRKASEQRRAAQVAARCRAGSGEGAHGTATCLPTQAGAAWGHTTHPKAIWGLPSSPAARYCSLVASWRPMSRAQHAPGATSGSAASGCWWPCPCQPSVGMGWDKGGTGNRSLVALLHGSAGSRNGIWMGLGVPG